MAQSPAWLARHWDRAEWARYGGSYSAWGIGFRRTEHCQRSKYRHSCCGGQPQRLRHSDGWLAARGRLHALQMAPGQRTMERGDNNRHCHLSGRSRRGRAFCGSDRQARFGMVPKRSGAGTRRAGDAISDLDGTETKVRLAIFYPAKSQKSKLMKNTFTLFLVNLTAAGYSLLAAQVDLSKLPPPASKTGLTYAKDIRPLFENTCFRCH